MLRKVLVLISAFVSLPALACSDHAVYSTVRDDGSELGLFLNKDIVSTPAWEPNGDEPPLSLGRAYSIALNWARSTYTRFDSVEIESISLQRYGCSTLHDRWYYVVNFRPYVDGASVFSSSHFAAVLMDGRVVAPRLSKAPSNRDAKPTR
jgi:hypothetical protein